MMYIPLGRLSRSEAGEEDAKDPLDQEQLARIQELESPSSASEEDDSS